MIGEPRLEGSKEACASRLSIDTKKCFYNICRHLWKNAPAKTKHWEDKLARQQGVDMLEHE